MSRSLGSLLKPINNIEYSTRGCSQCEVLLKMIDRPCLLPMPRQHYIKYIHDTDSHTHTHMHSQTQIHARTNAHTYMHSHAGAPECLLHKSTRQRDKVMFVCLI